MSQQAGRKSPSKVNNIKSEITLKQESLDISAKEAYDVSTMFQERMEYQIKVYFPG